ncbi:MAG: histidine phosphatase family protein [Dehalococcoidia bacterium]|nr:MAG: histidine phosphatase family protein [Dehalococcoidia bacterium]
MRLILVRHGETRWNQENRVVGHTGIALNKNGRKQVARLALALKYEKVSAIYSSPLRRARETAAAIARGHRLEVVTDDALKEVDAGELEGLTFEEVMERYGDFLQEWMKDNPSLRMPGGESMTELQERTWPAAERIVREHPDGVIILVSHSLAILSIISRALGMRLSNFRRLRLSVASISILDFGERGVSLVLFNDTCHLESGG